MVSKKYKVNLDEQARMQIKRIYEYIRKDSLQNAEKVRYGIIRTIKSLCENPERFPLDKYKEDNDGSYRAFVKYKLRVAYRIMDNQIKVFRVRSEKQEPLSY